MKKETAKALEDSIAHWERMRGFEGVEEFDKESIGDRYCDLCQLFLHWGCLNCPVSEKSGEMSCKKTPYPSAEIAFKRWLRKGTKKYRTIWRRAATREIKFLKSLREES